MSTFDRTQIEAIAKLNMKQFVVLALVYCLALTLTWAHPLVLEEQPQQLTLEDVDAQPVNDADGGREARGFCCGGGFGRGGFGGGFGGRRFGGGGFGGRGFGGGYPGGFGGGYPGGGYGGGSASASASASASFGGGYGK